MARKKPEVKVQATQDTKKTSQARIELPVDEFNRLRKAAKRRALSVSAFIRQAVLKEVDRVEGGRD